MKTIKSLKDITTLEVGDKVVFGDLEYTVCHMDGYFLRCSSSYDNDKIFTILNISKRDFVKNLGINTLPVDWDFPEVCSLEALTAIVSALLKEYEKQKELPKTWEEFCNKYPITPGKEAFINTVSRVMVYEDSRITRLVNDDRNLCISKQEAEAFTALMQLRQLRKVYVGNWEPDWEKDYKYKYGVNFSGNKLMVLEWCETSCTLSFPTEELAKQFLNNFKDLLEIAKPLL
jgi:hypothetical protein